MNMSIVIVPKTLQDIPPGMGYGVWVVSKTCYLEKGKEKLAEKKIHQCFCKFARILR